MFGELAPRLKGGLNQILSFFIGGMNLKALPGQSLVIQSGDSESNYQSGASVTINATSNVPQVPGAGVSGGSISINAGATGGVSNGGNGGSITISGGNHSGSNAGTGSAGSVTIQGGSGTAGSATSGSVTLQGGPNANNNGGSVTVTAPYPGAMSISTGSPAFNNQTAQNITLQTGNGTVSGSGGNIVFKCGTSSGSGSQGNVITNGQNTALATTATGGFLCLPTCAGAPTGTPASIPAGNVAIVYDTTNDKLWVYRGGAWAGVAI